MKWRLWSLLCFPIFKFSITQYVFLIFKVSVTQSATWVIFTELILTSLSQILILISSTIVLFSWRLVSDGNGSIGWDSTMFMWKIIFSLSNSKRRGAMIWLPKYYASSVGVPCCHCHMDGKLYKKHWGFKHKFFSGQILSEKYITRKERGEPNKQKRFFHAKLWTIRVWYGTQPPIYSLFTECSVYFIYVGWLSLNKCWEKSVRLYKMPDVPIFPKNGTSRVHTRMSKIRQTTIYKCVLQLEVWMFANVGSVSNKLCKQTKFSNLYVGGKNEVNSPIPW